MSKIKLPHASGNSMSIGAPATNPSGDLELKLPATIGTAGQVLRNSSTPGTLEFGANITEVDQWRLNTTANTSDSVLTANWERNDTAGFEKIGTGMSESSGIFSFPSTGKWKIFFHSAFAKASSDVRYVGGQIQFTINNSSYQSFAQAYANLFNDGTSCWGDYATECIVDVTDVSQCKVKFRVSAATTIDFIGTSTENYTYAIFTRIGDT
tara:strand:+ start:226 stop:855 length:630 start_codon:yes stop_codon:yes gene_type:complete